ncbi:hypothetical protein ACJ41O_008227 [Fusarium nematophilum]
MARSLTLLAGTLAVAAAQTSTVSFLLPLFDRQTLDASVVDVKGDATTLAIHCVNSDPDECGLTDTQTVVGGVSTMSMTYTIPGDDEFGPVSQDLKCNMNPKEDLLSCEVTVVGEMSGFEQTMVTTTTTTGYSDYLVPVTVTAGVNKLNANSSGDDDDDETATPGASASDSAPTTASKPNATDAKATDAAASGSESDAAATPVSTDNAAGPMVTQNAVLAGVAAVVGGAAMLL